MTIRRVRLVFGLLLLFASLAVLAWGLWPQGMVVESVPIGPLEMQLPALKSWLGAWV